MAFKVPEHLYGDLVGRGTTAQHIRDRVDDIVFTHNFGKHEDHDDRTSIFEWHSFDINGVEYVARADPGDSSVLEIESVGGQSYNSYEAFKADHGMVMAKPDPEASDGNPITRGIRETFTGKAIAGRPQQTAGPSRSTGIPQHDRYLQGLIEFLGEDTGRIDGIRGPNTTAALGRLGRLVPGISEGTGTLEAIQILENYVANMSPKDYVVRMKNLAPNASSTSPTDAGYAMQAGALARGEYDGPLGGVIAPGEAAFEPYKDLVPSTPATSATATTSTAGATANMSTRDAIMNIQRLAKMAKDGGYGPLQGQPIKIDGKPGKNTGNSMLKMIPGMTLAKLNAMSPQQYLAQLQAHLANNADFKTAVEAGMAKPANSRVAESLRKSGILPGAGAASTTAETEAAKTAPAETDTASEQDAKTVQAAMALVSKVNDANAGLGAAVEGDSLVIGLILPDENNQPALFPVFRFDEAAILKSGGDLKTLMLQNPEALIAGSNPMALKVLAQIAGMEPNDPALLDALKSAPESLARNILVNVLPMLEDALKPENVEKAFEKILNDSKDLDGVSVTRDGDVLTVTVDGEEFLFDKNDVAFSSGDLPTLLVNGAGVLFQGDPKAVAKLIEAAVPEDAIWRYPDGSEIKGLDGKPILARAELSRRLENAPEQLIKPEAKAALAQALSPKAQDLKLWGYANALAPIAIGAGGIYLARHLLTRRKQRLETGRSEAVAERQALADADAGKPVTADAPETRVRSMTPQQHADQARANIVRAGDTIKPDDYARERGRLAAAERHINPEGAPTDQAMRQQLREDLRARYNNVNDAELERLTNEALRAGQTVDQDIGLQAKVDKAQKDLDNLNAQTADQKNWKRGSIKPAHAKKLEQARQELETAQAELEAHHDAKASATSARDADASSNVSASTAADTPEARAQAAAQNAKENFMGNMEGREYMDKPMRQDIVHNVQSSFPAGTDQATIERAAQNALAEANKLHPENLVAEAQAKVDAAEAKMTQAANNPGASRTAYNDASARAQAARTELAAAEAELKAYNDVKPMTLTPDMRSDTELLNEKAKETSRKVAQEFKDNLPAGREYMDDAMQADIKKRVAEVFPVNTDSAVIHSAQAQALEEAKKMHPEQVVKDAKARVEALEAKAADAGTSGKTPSNEDINNLRRANADVTAAEATLKAYNDVKPMALTSDMRVSEPPSATGLVPAATPPEPPPQPKPSAQPGGPDPEFDARQRLAQAEIDGFDAERFRSMTLDERAREIGRLAALDYHANLQGEFMDSDMRRGIISEVNQLFDAGTDQNIITEAASDAFDATKDADADIRNRATAEIDAAGTRPSAAGEAKDATRVTATNEVELSGPGRIVMPDGTKVNTQLGGTVKIRSAAASLAALVFAAGAFVTLSPSDSEAFTPETLEFFEQGDFRRAGEAWVASANGEAAEFFAAIETEMPGTSHQIAAAALARTAGDDVKSVAYLAELGLGPEIMQELSSALDHGEQALEHYTSGNIKSALMSDAKAAAHVVSALSDFTGVTGVIEAETNNAAFGEGLEIAFYATPLGLVTGAAQIIQVGGLVLADLANIEVPTWEKMQQETLFDYIWTSNEEAAFEAFMPELHTTLQGMTDLPANMPQEVVDAVTLHMAMLAANRDLEQAKADLPQWYDDDRISGMAKIEEAREHAVNIFKKYETMFAALHADGRTMNVLGYLDAHKHHQIPDQPPPGESPSTSSKAFVSAADPTKTSHGLALADPYVENAMLWGYNPATWSAQDTAFVEAQAAGLSDHLSAEVVAEVERLIAKGFFPSALHAMRDSFFDANGEAVSGYNTVFDAMVSEGESAEAAAMMVDNGPALVQVVTIETHLADRNMLNPDPPAPEDLVALDSGVDSLNSTVGMKTSGV